MKKVSAVKQLQIM